MQQEESPLIVAIVKFQGAHMTLPLHELQESGGDLQGTSKHTAGTSRSQRHCS